jgi:hypothetical protein
VARPGREDIRPPWGGLSALGGFGDAHLAEDRGLIMTNHLKDFRRLYHSDRADLIWLPQHIESFMNVGPPLNSNVRSSLRFTPGNAKAISCAFRGPATTGWRSL